MSYRFASPWHKISFERFLSTRLPELLAERLPLAGYHVDLGEGHTCHVRVELTGNGHAVAADYGPIFMPDEQGLFWFEEHPRLVVPHYTLDDLERAEVHCVGEQLYEVVYSRLSQLPAGLAWDDGLLRALLPLDEWINTFLRRKGQWLDTTNWAARHTHLRRIINFNRQVVIEPGEQGRVDPFETPEGAYIGKIFTVAAGAEIRDERLVIVDPSPVGGLGHTSLLVPFIEHDDPNRLLMGVNMIRQAPCPPDPEPALVQTGYEPDWADPQAHDLWCGRNLLTAFIDGGEATALDGVILSQSAAQRLDHPYPAEAGDKLANRHGTKGVVAQVLPDEQMPHLADGTPVELVYSFYGLHRRLNFGQMREAVMGRIARAEGKPAIVPPFAAPSAEEIRARLAQAGLPEDGMERLRWGQDGAEMPLPSGVGWVYWYRSVHRSREKLEVSDAGTSGYQLDEAEIGALCQAGAVTNAAEALNARSLRRPDVRTLAERLAGGPIEPAGPPTPMFAALEARLRAAGVAADLEGEKLSFRPVEPLGEPLKLARPVPHPWIPEHMLAAVGRPPEETAWHLEFPWFGYMGWATTAALDWVDDTAKPGLISESFSVLEETNRRLERLLSSQVPRRLVEEAERQLQTCLAAYLEALLPATLLRFAEPQAFSARAVIAPGDGLGIEQVGLPEEIVRALFGSSSEHGEKTREMAMSDTWVLVLRSPAVAPNAFVALHPVAVDGPAVRLNPQTAEMLNADFDGDQVAVFLPLSAQAQREAGERLSVAGHLRRDPKLIRSLLPPANALWGLAWLSLGPECGQVEQVLGRPFTAPLTQDDLDGIVGEVLASQGPQAALHLVERLAQIGYAASRASGASLSPFAGEKLLLPPAPVSEDPQAWQAYSEVLAEQILGLQDFTDPDLGPQLLSVAIRSRGRWELPILVGLRGIVNDAAGQPVIVRHSNVHGLSPEELFACVAGARRGLAQVVLSSQSILDGTSAPGIGQAGKEPPRRHILARARRARHPGIILARAAANKESDPLEDVESRLTVGLPVA